MKLPESKFESQTLGAEKEMAFSIESENSVIFDILRDKMYSNKIAAVCREVSSNSRDANREGGCGDKATQIIMAEPNEYLGISDMAIVFRDFGTGITPDRMESIFLKYGASTKRDTNNQTGGFGLGAKTPFAYNDTFTVITVCDWEGKRMKFTYNAMIDTSRKGKMVLWDEEETEEVTGTKIIVPIDEEDRYKFEGECYKATLLWDIRPEYLNFNSHIPVVEDLMEAGDGQLMMKDCEDSNITGGGQKYILLIDGIPYPITDISVIGDYPLDFDGSVFIPFNNGDLTIAANRETVQYDKATIKTIQTKLKGIRKYFIKQIKSWFKSNMKKSFIDSCLLLQDYNRYKSNSWNIPQDNFIKTLVRWERVNDDFKKEIKEGWKKIDNQFPVPLRGTIGAFDYFCIKILKQDAKGFKYIERNNINSRWKDSIFFVKGDKKLNKRRSESALLEVLSKNQGSEVGDVYIIEAPKFEKLPYEAREKAIREAFMMQELFEIDIRFYDDLKYSARRRESADGTIIKPRTKKGPKEDVLIHSRIFDEGQYYPTTLRYVYDFEMVQLPTYGIDSICFLTTDKISSFKYEQVSREKSITDLLWRAFEIRTIIVTKKAWDKYFKDFDYPTLEGVFEEKKSKLRNLLIQQNEITNKNNVWNVVDRAYLGDKLKHLLPNEWRDVKGAISDLEIQYSIIDDSLKREIVGYDLYDNYADIEERFRNISESNPLVQKFVDTMGWRLVSYIDGDLAYLRARNYHNDIKAMDEFFYMLELMKEKNPRINKLSRPKRKMSR